MIKKRGAIALLSVLVGIAYVYLVGIDFINHWDDHANSFRQGYNASARERNGQLPEESFLLSLNSKDLQHYYIDSVLNLKNNRYLPAKLNSVDVFYQFNEYTEVKQVLKYRAIILFTAFISLFLLIAVPVYFYSIMGAFYKHKIFDHENVRRLNILGILLLIIFTLQLVVDITDYYYKKSLIEIANYHLSIHLSGAEWLFMGLIVLLGARILKRSVELKEEQELTI